MEMKKSCLHVCFNLCLLTEQQSYSRTRTICKGWYNCLNYGYNVRYSYKQEFQRLFKPDYTKSFTWFEV